MGKIPFGTFIILFINGLLCSVRLFRSSKTFELFWFEKAIRKFHSKTNAVCTPQIQWWAHSMADLYKHFFFFSETAHSGFKRSFFNGDWSCLNLGDDKTNEHNRLNKTAAHAIHIYWTFFMKKIIHFSTSITEKCLAQGIGLKKKSFSSCGHTSDLLGYLYLYGQMVKILIIFHFYCFSAVFSSTVGYKFWWTISLLSVNRL